MKSIILFAAILRIIFISAIISFAVIANAQSVAVNTTGNTADASAMLDVSSNTKGFLPPRMTTIQRTGIASPANGLMVFDMDTKTYWYHSDSWKEITNAGSGGAFSLPYSGSYNIVNSVFAITNTNTQQGSMAILGRVSSEGSGFNTLGITAGVWGDNSIGAGVLGTNKTGVGVYGSSIEHHGVYGITSSPSYAGVYGSNATGAAIRGESNGTGIGVHGKGGGLNSKAALFQNTDTDNTNPTIESNNLGKGSAGYFSASYTFSYSPTLNVNSLTNGDGIYVSHGNVGGNDNSALTAEHLGSGYGVYGKSNLGVAGRFEINTAANNYPTLTTLTKGSASAFSALISNTANNSYAAFVGTNGIGGGIDVSVTNSNAQGDGLVISNYGTGNGIKVFTSKGIGGQFYTNNSTNNLPVIHSSHSGTGNAGYFSILNSASTNAVLFASTNGTGPGLVIDNIYVNAVSSLATFKKNGTNKARIDGTGKGFFNGGTQASGADVAEAFDVADDIKSYEAGDILIISTEKDRAVVKSNGAYSTLVAGVYATKPGVLLTEEDIETDISDKVPMGVVGVIPTKVCLEGGEIKRGDLLVTSSITGVAMKADIDKVKPGQVIGKALENFNSSSIGKIKVLVNVK